MKISVLAGSLLLSLASYTAYAVDGVVKDGKWTMLEEPMQIGNQGLIFDASVKAEEYESGPVRDMMFSCNYKKTRFTVRVIGENLSSNNGEVVYSIDDGPKREWLLYTEAENGVYLRSEGDIAADIIRELLGHEKVTVFLKLQNGTTKELDFNIIGIEDRIRYVLVLCNI